MKVDILVLTHNHLEMTKQFVEAIYSHTPREAFSFYVMDNGSSDGTAEWLSAELRKQDSDSHSAYLWRVHDDLGVVAGRNRLWDDWKQCDTEFPEDSGDALLFLDNDQIVKDGWLEQHVAYLQSGFDIVGTEAWRLGVDFLPYPLDGRRCESFNYIGASGMMMTASAAKVLDGFDTLFSPAFFEDADYCIRAFDAGLRVGLNANAQIDHLAHYTLGKMDWPPIFAKSHSRFKKKWNGRQLPVFTQPCLNT